MLLFFQIVLSILDPLYFHIYLASACEVLQKNPTGILIEVALNLQISLWRKVILMILSFHLHEHGMSLQSLISFGNVL